MLRELQSWVELGLLCAILFILIAPFAGSVASSWLWGLWQ
jgi:hypothetical protein